MNRTLTILAAFYLALALILAGWVYRTTLHGEFAALRVNGETRLNEAAARLRLQVDRFRGLTNVISTQPAIVSAVSKGDASKVATNLTDLALTYGAERVDLVDPSGTLLASSVANTGQLGASGSLIRAALNSRLGFEQAITEGRRVIRLSRAVVSPSARAVIIVTIDLASLEFEWPVTPEPVVFFDRAQQVFSSNRPSLLQLSKAQDPEEAQLNLVQTGSTGRFDLWRFGSVSEQAREVLLVEKLIPHLDLTGTILLDSSAARATARLRLLLELALALVLGLIGAMVFLSRKQLAIEAQHSSELEARVDARTQELRKAQNEIVETSKLAALGRLSAGVSHELNQPLAAILNFASNGQKLLSKGRVDTANENFRMISDQIERMTRIIGNLRAFARQDVTPTEKVDFKSIVENAYDLMTDDIKNAGVDVEVVLPDHPVYVLAGRVRLEQVMVNLISNALDAMAPEPVKMLTLLLTADEKTCRLAVQDTGAGIEEPDRVFEPFYSSKDLGASKGLGMGLSLSFGIVARFGGQLTCFNQDKGATFQIELPTVGERDA